MATQIKITPTLSGEASYRFNLMLAKNAKKKLSAKEKAHIKKLVKSVMSKNPVLYAD